MPTIHTTETRVLMHQVVRQAVVLVVLVLLVA